MKCGVHVALSRWPEDITPHIRSVKALGFDGVEISLLGMSDEKIDFLYRLTRDLELEVTCTTGLSPEHDVASADPAVREAGRTYLRWGVETVSKLGSELLTGVIFVPWGYFRPGEKADRLARSAESLASVEDARAGLVFIKSRAGTAG
ncbi:MAG: TIM barrel protein [Inquilinaceae bacterium]